MKVQTPLKTISKSFLRHILIGKDYSICVAHYDLLIKILFLSVTRVSKKLIKKVNQQKFLNMISLRLFPLETLAIKHFIIQIHRVPN